MNVGYIVVIPNVISCCSMSESASGAAGETTVDHALVRKDRSSFEPGLECADEELEEVLLGDLRRCGAGFHQALLIDGARSTRVSDVADDSWWIDLCVQCDLDEIVATSIGLEPQRAARCRYVEGTPLGLQYVGDLTRDRNGHVLEKTVVVVFSIGDGLASSLRSFAGGQQRRLHSSSDLGNFH